MQMKLMLRPDSDESVVIGSYYLEKFKLQLEQAGVTILDLAGMAVNRQNLEDTIKSYRPISIYANGHGEQDILYGQDFEPIVTKGVNENIFAGMVVHLLACQTGKKGGLLESIVENGAVAGIGYNVDYIVGYSSTLMSDEIVNQITQSFIKSDLQIEYSLAHGASVAEAIADSDRVSDEEISKWTRSSIEDRDFVIWALINNRDGKVVYGIPSIQPRTTGSERIVTAGIITGLGALAAVLFTRGGN